MKSSCGTKKYAKGGEAKMTDQERQMMQEVQDEKDRRKAEKAYNEATTSTMPAPKKKMGGGMMTKGYAKGGMVAKTRGMGAASRGGKCKMY